VAEKRAALTVGPHPDTTNPSTGGPCERVEHCGYHDMLWPGYIYHQQTKFAPDGEGGRPTSKDLRDHITLDPMNTPDLWWETQIEKRC